VRSLLVGGAQVEGEVVLCRKFHPACLTLKLSILTPTISQYVSSKFILSETQTVLRISCRKLSRVNSCLLNYLTDTYNFTT
jgi:hypothetical protein